MSSNNVRSKSATPREAAKPFTKAQVAKIGRLLKLDATESCLAAQAIEQAIDRMEAARVLRSVVDVDSDLAWLKRAPDRLNGALATLNELLDAKGPSLPVFMAAHAIGISLSVSKVIEAQNTLASLIALTKSLSENPNGYRLIAYQPPAQKSHATSQALYLWPTLFRLWQQSNQPWGVSKARPLYEFIKLVHDHAELAEPVPTTLQHQVKQFKARTKGSSLAV